MSVAASQPFSMLIFLGALAIFLYGMRLGRVGLQLAGGDRLRSIVSHLTNNRFKALGMGAVTTLILQSSSATTVMLVGLAGSHLINLTQAMGVILGADIGTSLVVMLLSVKKMAEYSLLILIVGVAIDIIGSKKKTRYISMIFLGFGFVFFGMHMMTQAMIPLRGNPWVTELMGALAYHPFYNLLFATVFTAIVNSSTTTIGLAIALAFGGTISIEAAIPIIFGANIGTCGTALFACVGGKVEGKRVALAHLIFKIGGVAIFFPFLPYLVQGVHWLTQFGYFGDASVARQIAVTHLMFNLGLSLIFIPFVHQGVWLIRKLIPYSASEKERQFGAKYLDKGALDTPALALAMAKREILRMADIAFDMYKEVISVFSKRDLEKIDILESKDDRLDYLNREIKFYLARLSQSSLTDEEADTELNYVSIVSDLEEIGDIINRNLMELAEKKIRKLRKFSDEGWAEIQEFHMKVQKNFDLAISAITSGDETVAQSVFRHAQQIQSMETGLRQAHLNRLHKGLKLTFETSSMHLDLLANIQRISSKITTIVSRAFPNLGSAFSGVSSQKP